MKPMNSPFLRCGWKLLLVVVSLSLWAQPLWLCAEDSSAEVGASDEAQDQTDLPLGFQRILDESESPGMIPIDESAHIRQTRNSLAASTTSGIRVQPPSVTRQDPADWARPSRYFDLFTPPTIERAALSPPEYLL